MTNKLMPVDRIGTRRAARLLGVSVRHVRRLGAAGALDIVDLRVPGAPRACWSVGLASLLRLLEERRGGPLVPLAPEIAASARVDLRRAVPKETR